MSSGRSPGAGRPGHSAPAGEARALARLCAELGIATAFGHLPGRDAVEAGARAERDRRDPALFREGAYLPLATAGTRAQQVLAFARRHQGTTLVAIGGRLWTRLACQAGTAPLGAAVWSDTTVTVDLPHGTRLTDVLSGQEVMVEHGRIAVGQAFARLPAAALVSGA